MLSTGLTFGGGCKKHQWVLQGRVTCKPAAEANNFCASFSTPLELVLMRTKRFGPGCPGRAGAGHWGCSVQMPTMATWLWGGKWFELLQDYPGT